VGLSDPGWCRIKASKSCFEVKEPIHQKRVGSFTFNSESGLEKSSYKFANPLSQTLIRQLADRVTFFF